MIGNDGFVSEIRSCSHCGGDLIRTHDRDAAVFSEQGFISGITMSKSTCILCRKEFFYDGRSHGILNFANTYIFTVEMFKGFLELKINAGLSVHAWWCAKVQNVVIFRLIGTSKQDQ
jgi:hypothetical protein